jgi:pyridoxamine 5'-phosphate oxidase
MAHEDIKSAAMSEREMDCFKTHPVESEPLLLFKKLFAQAERAETAWAHNFALCTVDPDGQPTSRVVSMHSFDERGFFFCTNTSGPKATALGDLFCF